jgi:hypothetical protein
MVIFTNKPWKHPSIRHPVTGESGKWTAVNGRDIFVPSSEQDPVEVGEKELERWEHPPPSNRSSESEPGENPNEEVIKPEDNEDKEKDGAGFGDLGNQHNQGTGDNYDAIDDETYIGLPANEKRTKMNKIQDTHIGDLINFYVNGVNDKGVVTKMSGAYIEIVKEDGKIHNIHINDTFFVKNIIVNKTWDDMDGTERTLALTKARAPSPRFIGKDWNQLPRELQDVLTKTGFTYEDGVTRDAETEDHDRMGNFQDKGVGAALAVADAATSLMGEDKSDVEQGVYGGIPTNTPFDADEDYEEEAGDKKEQFGLEEEAPVTKDDDGVTTDGVNAVYSDVAEGKRRQKGVPEQVGETYGLQYGVKGLCNKKDNT